MESLRESYPEGSIYHEKSAMSSEGTVYQEKTPRYPEGGKPGVHHEASKSLHEGATSYRDEGATSYTDHTATSYTDQGATSYTDQPASRDGTYTDKYSKRSTGTIKVEDDSNGKEASR